MATETYSKEMIVALAHRGPEEDLSIMERHALYQFIQGGVILDPATFHVHDVGCFRIGPIPWPKDNAFDIVADFTVGMPMVLVISVSPESDAMGIVYDGVWPSPVLVAARDMINIVELCVDEHVFDEWPVIEVTDDVTVSDPITTVVPMVVPKTDHLN